MLRRNFLKVLGALLFVPSVLKGKDDLVAVLLCLLENDKALIDNCPFDIREMEEKKYIHQMLQAFNTLLYDARASDYRPVKIVSTDMGNKNGFVRTEMVLYCKQGEPMKEKSSIFWEHRSKKITVFDYDITESVLTLYPKRERQLDKILFEIEK